MVYKEVKKLMKRGSNMKTTNKKRIIEIYVTENKKEDTVSFEFEKVENSKIADSTMKMLLMMFNKYKDNEDELEVEYEEKEEV